jgi:hypothetical protein
MKIYIDDSYTGSGKTERAINRMVMQPSRNIFVTERTNSFDELRNRITKAAERFSKSVQVHQILSGINNRGGSVSIEIERLPSLYSYGDHVVILITHAALIQSDFSAFRDWRLVVDEVPRFIDFQEKRTSLSASFFYQNYNLTPLLDNWGYVTLTEAGSKLSPADIRADQSHAHLATFHERVSKASRDGGERTVICNLTSWEEMKGKSTQWCWASIFSLRDLQAFQRVEFLGNCFQKDIASILTQFVQADVEWVKLPPPLDNRQFKSRTVEICYFSEIREASRSFFETIEGQRVLSDIARYLGNIIPTEGMIWTANEGSVKPALGNLGDTYLTPKQAGTNQFSHISNAAALYTAKSSPNLRSLLKLFSVDPNEWTRSVEYEVILQFVTRTSIRNPESDATVRLWVFDKHQANYLKEYFDRLPHLKTAIFQAPLELKLPQRQRSGPKAVVRTPEEEKQYINKKREANTRRKALARQALAEKASAQLRDAR